MLCLGEDPGEQNNAVGAHPEIARERSRHKAHRAAPPLPDPYDGPSTVPGVRFVEDKGSEDRNIRAVA